MSLFQDPVPYRDIFTQFAEKFSVFNPTCKKNSTFDQVSDCFAEKSLKTLRGECWWQEGWAGWHRHEFDLS